MLLAELLRTFEPLEHLIGACHGLGAGVASEMYTGETSRPCTASLWRQREA